MVFWLAVLVGVLFIFVGVEVGFLVSWIVLFHLILGTYLAIFGMPVLASTLPDVVATPYGFCLALLVIVVVTVLAGYGICHACLSGQLRPDFPQVVNTVGAGAVSFLAGLLAASVLGLAFCLTPWSDSEFATKFGLDNRSQRTSISLICRCCDGLHFLVASYGDDDGADQAVEALLKAHDLILHRELKPNAAAAPAATPPAETKEEPSLTSRIKAARSADDGS